MFCTGSWGCVMREEKGHSNAAPRRDEALAFIIERIARTGNSPTFYEIGNELGVSDTRAKQLVAQLIKRGHIERTPGEVRSLRVCDVTGSRNLLENALRQLGWHTAEPMGELLTPFLDRKLSLLPPFEHLPDFE